MHLRPFPPDQSAVVAGWPADAAESARWCGRPEVPASTVAGWAGEDGVRAFGLYESSSAADDERLVAYGELWIDEDEVELARLIVDPARRGQGIGRLLVAELVAQAPLPTIFMRVHPDNAAALRTYAASGFVRVDPDQEAEWNQPQPVAYVWLTLPPAP